MNIYDTKIKMVESHVNMLSIPFNFIYDQTLMNVHHQMVDANRHVPIHLEAEPAPVKLDMK